MSLKAMATPSMSSLENDDSFVILGSSPPQSMIASTTVGTSMSLIPHPTEQSLDSEKPQMVNGGSSPELSMQNGAVGGNESAQGHSSMQTKPVSMIDKSFASKIILGQIDCKSMQSSLFQQFPSLSHSQVQVDDIMKISCMVEEHQELKGEMSHTFDYRIVCFVIKYSRNI